ncbi:MAG TPA: lipoyl(octanoyl) transferase LipB [Candidatus Deferrimicrobiaceae bacterium]|nr:lipoyl(octanoyl) transferase LipB [Candidatus Deferrimicrobiaceae bacterium]
MDAAPQDRGTFIATWLGRVSYRDAWALQKTLVDQRADGRIGDVVLLLEHDAVLTLGRQADEGHVLASPRELRRRGIEVIRVERGGEVTYHGPGQLVGYPILRLADRGILVRPLVEALEGAMLETCEAYGVTAIRRSGHPGAWVAGDRGRPPRKIGALGLRIERGISYHGIALNVDPDLRDFDLIDPCGMPGLVSTSIAEELGRSAEAPSTEAVETAATRFADAFAGGLGATVEWWPAERLRDLATVAAAAASERP